MQKSMDSALFWIALSSIPGIGRATFRKLKEFFGTPEGALRADRRELQNIEGLSQKVITGITTCSWHDYAEQELSRADRSGIRIITADDESYPQSLRNIPDAPLFLYVKGELKQEDCIAVVGTRKPTHYGLTVTHRIAYELSAGGLTVISGMARGIDTQAHRGALAAKGRTIAVLGCGIDVQYPPENRDLMQTIARSGAVVTEYPFGTRPEAGYFPARNRIISGLSLGTIIVEAAEDSGSLITADYTRAQGRQLFAVPGNIGSASSRGANSLIKQGAVLIEGSRDVFSAIGIERPKQRQEMPGKKVTALSSEEERAFRCITDDPKHIDIVMNESGHTAGKLSAVLIMLELKGLVKQLPGKFYVRSC